MDSTLFERTLSLKSITFVIDRKDITFYLTTFKKPRESR